MTSILTDEVYESMDPISQMLEPFESKILNLIRSLPETFYIKDDVIIKLLADQCRNRNSYLSVYTFINEHVGISTNNYDHDSYDSLIIRSAFDPNVEGSFSFCEVENKHIGDLPKISFTKNKVKSTEHHILKTIIENAKNSSNRFDHHVFTSEDLVRLKDLADVLDIPSSETKYRSRKKWFKLIFNKLESNILNSVWRVRSEDAIYNLFKMVEIVYYGDKGWESKKMNLIHLKLMIRSNKPIYKITEI